MKRQACCTVKQESGRVRVRYWRAPVRLRYSIGFESGFPSDSNDLDFVSASVRHGLKFDMWARSRSSVAYCCWDRNKLSHVR
jgi:hypothetical protein